MLTKRPRVAVNSLRLFGGSAGTTAPLVTDGTFTFQDLGSLRLVAAGY